MVCRGTRSRRRRGACPWSTCDCLVCTYIPFYPCLAHAIMTWIDLPTSSLSSCLSLVRLTTRKYDGRTNTKKQAWVSFSTGLVCLGRLSYTYNTVHIPSSFKLAGMIHDNLSCHACTAVHFHLFSRELMPMPGAGRSRLSRKSSNWSVSGDH